MLHRRDLEALHPTTLAVLCHKLASISSDGAAATEARELQMVWVELQTPPSISLKAEREKDAKRRAVRERMIDHLDGRNEVELYPNP